MPLNGAAANTEGGRLQRKIQGVRMCYTSGDVSSVACCGPRPSIQFPITPSENSRITLLTATMNGTLLNSGGVTQERAKQILASGIVGPTITETVRTTLLQQRTIACSADSPTLQPIILPGCPPLPPPPAPPARACPLTKNQKF
jgi:hypothetical protein